MLLTDVARLPSANGPRIVVIGSGAIGLYVASELVKRGRDVVVIEAGERHLGNFDAASFASVGRENDGIRIGRSRSLGGTTNLWGGQLVEFQPVDFAGREWLPSSKWPVTYDEVAPFYSRTYENLGIDAAKQSDEAVWKSVSAERPRIGDEFEPFLTRWLQVPNFATYYDEMIRENPKLHVLTGQTAVGFAGNGGKVTAVRVKDAAGVERAIEGDTFILAAGTIESSRLLLHCAAEQGGGWKGGACPWRGNQNVGAYFQDHLGGKMATVLPKDTKKFFNTFCTIAKSGHKYQPKIRLRNDVQARDRILNIQGLFAFESSATEHLVYLKQFLKAALYSRKFSGIGDFLRNSIGSAKYLVPLMWRYAWDHRVFVPSTSRIDLLVQAEQMPVAESRIRIDAGSVDRFGLPRAVLDWRLGGVELESIHAFVTRADAALRAAGIAELKINEDLAAKNPRYLGTLKDTLHQSGGTVMGWSEKDGVVDKDLRVFGTENLYVGGSSTFRTIGNANTTFVALAFMTRLVEKLTRGA
jgi:choline dehydrogenase-like flavoprotein